MTIYMNPLSGTWRNPEHLGPRRYTCGHCGALVAPAQGYYQSHDGSAKIYICSGCNRPSYFEGASQVPGVPSGQPVKHLPDPVDQLYEEARRASSANAPTTAILAVRKLLMHIAVDRGALPDQSFLSYVEYLSQQGFLPPNGKTWVDHIREKGNEANHEIVLMSSPDADELISFAEILLKFVYEFPNRVPASP